MTFGQAIVAFWKNYANFKGRATRSEYWWAFLFVALVGAGISIVTTDYSASDWTDTTESALSNLWSLVVLLPGLSVAARRLHDVGRPATHLFYLLIPIAGIIMVLIWLTKESVVGKNQFDV
ncbi:MAG: hypothetical protein RLZ41_693 [Actinomycetota bacterium]|jgi:uncharacterized membrane protein YhaH (DUF805 family)